MALRLSKIQNWPALFQQLTKLACKFHFPHPPSGMLRKKFHRTIAERRCAFIRQFNISCPTHHAWHGVAENKQTRLIYVQVFRQQAHFFIQTSFHLPHVCMTLRYDRLPVAAALHHSCVLALDGGTDSLESWSASSPADVRGLKTILCQRRRVHGSD